MAFPFTTTDGDEWEQFPVSLQTDRQTDTIKTSNSEKQQ